MQQINVTLCSTAKGYKDDGHICFYTLAYSQSVCTFCCRPSCNGQMLPFLFFLTRTTSCCPCQVTHTHTRTSHQTEIFKSVDICQSIFTLRTRWANSVCHFLDYKGPHMKNQTLLLDWSRLIMMEMRKVKSRQGLCSRVPLGGTQINPRIILPACSILMPSIQRWHLNRLSALYSASPQSTEHTDLDDGSTILSTFWNVL